MALCSDESISDEEIFFGKLSLKEVKKHILFNSQRQTISFVFIFLLRLFVITYVIMFIIKIKNRYIKLLTDLRCSTENKKKLSDESVSVIETQSEPDLHAIRDTIASLDYSNPSSPRVSTDWDIKSTDDSFLKIEKMVTDMCKSPQKNNADELDNTLEVIEFILNNAHSNNDGMYKSDDIVSKEKIGTNYTEPTQSSPLKKFNSIDDKNEAIESPIKPEESKTITQLQLQIERLYKTPLKKVLDLEKDVQNVKKENILTPSMETKATENVFKTPKNPLSTKKNQLASTKKTPGKTNAYQHITSPVASYIKNCPQVPLLRDVHPKKPLPSSSIPKFVKPTGKVDDDKIDNKENVLLPSIAYRSAKKTKLITIPNKEKLPQSPWAKKLASSLPKPVVIKHDHREMNTMKKSTLNNQEDSFANLSLHQADLSVCTEKSAVPKLL